MDESKVFCAQCKRMVNPYTHIDCTFPPDNLQNFQQYERGITSQCPQVSNPSIWQGGRESRNLLQKKPDFANREILIQHPTKGISSSINSTRPRTTGVNNSGVQGPEKTDYRNNPAAFQRQKEDNRFHYEPAQVYNAENQLRHNAAYIDPRIGQTSFGKIHQENRFQNAMPQNNERKRLYQKNPRINYGQNFANSTSQPYAISDFSTAFPTPTPNKRMNAFGNMEQQQYFNNTQPQNSHAYDPQLNMVNPNRNMRVESHSGNLNNSSTGSEHAVPLSSITPENLMLNTEMKLLVQNKLPLLCQISEEKISNEIGEEFDISDYLLLELSSESIGQKNEKKNTPQKNAEQSAHQTNEASSSEKPAANSVQEKDAEQSVYWKDSEQSVHQKDAELSVKYAEQRVKEKDAEQGVKQKDTELSVKDAEQRVKQKDAEQRVKQKDAEQRVKQKDAEQRDDEQSIQQTNEGIFTGEGPASLDEYIERLYNGTLYKCK